MCRHLKKSCLRGSRGLRAFGAQHCASLSRSASAKAKQLRSLQGSTQGFRCGKRSEQQGCTSMPPCQEVPQKRCKAPTCGHPGPQHPRAEDLLGQGKGCSRPWCLFRRQFHVAYGSGSPRVLESSRNLGSPHTRAVAAQATSQRSCAAADCSADCLHLQERAKKKRRENRKKLSQIAAVLPHR